MANLARPVNMLNPVEERIIEFKGLNKRTVVEEGEMSDMKNLTADAYPVLKPRKPRGEIDMPEGAMRPLQMITHHGKLAMIAIVDDSDNVGFFYDGVRYDDDLEDFELTTASRMIAINTKICFFPEKTYISCRRTDNGVVVGEDYGSLEASEDLLNVSLTLGTSSITIPLSDGHGFKYDDAINITGVLEVVRGGVTRDNINVSCIVEDACSDEGAGYITIPMNTFIEATGATSATIIEGTISRTMKTLDHMIVWNNRLWGVNNAENTIYASKLGDPTNWQYYQGTSLDSYYAEQGTDEMFTGVAEYSGHLLFFKPSSITRVYGSAPSNYQIMNAKMYGIEEGSSKSALTINDTVFYKSAIGIMAYQGGVPFCISDKFNEKFKNVVAATEGTKYYASCLFKREESYEGRLMVFDISKGLWHKEDNLRITSACQMENKIYCTSASGVLIFCSESLYCSPSLMCCSNATEDKGKVINPDNPSESYEDIEWMAVFGPFDEWIEEHKIYSKLAMRLVAKGEASASVYISINEGPWEQVEHYEHVSTKGDFIPIIPRRCDRYSVKIEGKGNCEVKSLTRRVRKGSFGRL